MAKNGRPGLPREVRVRFWDGIRAGLGTREAAAAGAGKSVGSVWFAAAGGVKGNGAAAGSGRYLCLAEREEIALGLARGESFGVIGARLGRAVSTISREVERNGCRGVYRAVAAQAQADARAARPKQAKLAGNAGLRAWVQVRLMQKWSPEQISRRLAAEFGDRLEMRVSHETIYQSIYVQGRGALRRELAACLRTGGRCAGPAGKRASGGGRSRAW